MNQTKFCSREFFIAAGNNLEHSAVSQLLQTCCRMVSTQEFESVVSRFYKPLYQFAFSLTRAEADACDLTQQTFYIWATKGHQLRDSSKLKTWLFTTLHRMFLETHRRQTRFPHQELDGALMETLTSTSAELTRLDTAQAMNALSRLDAIYQAPVSLFYLQDCSYKEIAEVLEVPIGTVKSRLARGLSQMQQMLEARGKPNNSSRGKSP